MADTNTVETPRKVAKHAYLGPSGDVVDSINDATGIRYENASDGWVFDWQIPDASAGTPQTLVAVFGAKTLAINTCSGARQRDEDEQESLVERFGNLEQGTWRERAEGATRGPKYDKAVLAQVLHATLVADGHTPAGDPSHYLERLEDRSYYAKVRANTKVMAAYMQEMAKRGVTAGDTGGLA